MTHVLNRLRFEIGCSDEEQAFQVRHNFARTLQDVALETIDSLCSKHVGDDEWLQIDSIDIDLGVLNPHAIERELASVFRARFEQELVKKLAARRLDTRTTSAAHSRFELFCHIVTKGVLPWWAPEGEIDLDAIVQELHTTMPDALRTFLRTHREDRVVWRRLALQLRDAASAAIISLVEELRQAEASIGQAVEGVLRQAAGSTGGAAGADVIQARLVAARRMVIEHAPQIFAQPLREATVARLLAEVISAFADGGRDVEADAPTPSTAESKSEAGVNLTPTATGEHPPSANAVAEDVFVRQGRRISSESETLPDERYVVRHSGLVLLAPFFARFLDACELLDSASFKDKEAQYTAIHLLRYLCAGTQRNAEHDLTLEKLCCGVALNEPIPRDVDLQPFQLAEARSLLASVIEHWKALKNTSIDGLRETFLKRDGILTRHEGDWLLRVERKTLDVLIDGIPWGYSTLVMPWNDYAIHVEW